MRAIIEGIKRKSKLLWMAHWPICVVLGIALVLHLLAFWELGYDYSLNSDDASYIKSGIRFLETGMITMHDVRSAQVMPGMTFFIAFVSFFFGSGDLFMVVLKLIWITMGLCTIGVTYRTMRLFANQYCAAVACMFFLAADYIWMDQLILTETPFILFFVLMIDQTLQLAIHPTRRGYILIVLYYMIELLIRPNNALYPLLLIVYLLWKQYDWRLLIKQLLIAGGVLLLFVIPWTYRNYQLFDRLIPLTYGMGNPLLLGTYQGFNYPTDEELDYKTNVYDQMPDQMKYYLEHPEEKDYLTKYYSLEYDGMVAKYRMQEWWKRDKIAMLKSYLIYKPKILIYSRFYWDSILGIAGGSINLSRGLDLILFTVASLLIFMDRNHLKEWCFLMAVYVSQIALYAYSFAFERYAISLFFIRYIVIAIGMQILLTKIRKGAKNESIDHYSGI